MKLNIIMDSYLIKVLYVYKEGENESLKFTLRQYFCNKQKAADVFHALRDTDNKRWKQIRTLTHKNDLFLLTSMKMKRRLVFFFWCFQFWVFCPFSPSASCIYFSCQYNFLQLVKQNSISNPFWACLCCHWKSSSFFIVFTTTGKL